MAEALREEQYQIALSWNGQQALSAFDLSARNLMDIKLKGAILNEANLSEANLSEANLQGTKLRRAKYNENTTWPTGFNPQAHGAVLVED